MSNQEFYWEWKRQGEMHLLEAEANGSRWRVHVIRFLLRTAKRMYERTY